jgi:hypothetical protein
MSQIIYHTDDEPADVRMMPRAELTLHLEGIGNEIKMIIPIDDLKKDFEHYAFQLRFATGIYEDSALSSNVAIIVPSKANT